MHLFCSDLFYFGAVGDKSLVKFRNWLKFGGFRNPQFGFLLLCSKHIKLILAFLFDFAISTTLTTRKGLFTPRLPALICRDVLVALCVGQRLLLWFSGDRTTEENQWAFFPAYLPAQNQHVNEAFSHWGLLRCAFCVAQRWLIPVVLAALANGRWWAQQASVWKGLSRVGQRRTQQAASLGTKGLDNNPKPRRVFTTRRSFNQLEIPRGVYKGVKIYFRYFHIFHASNDTLGHQKLHYSNYLALICNFDTISKCQTQHCDIAVLVHHFPTCLLQCCLCGHIKWTACHYFMIFYRMNLHMIIET